MENNTTKARFDRFKDAEWFDNDNKPVMVGGAGGISSWLTLLLKRAGFEPHVYDFDLLEAHNLGGQLYGTKHIGMPKVVALHDIVKMFTGEELHKYNEKVTANTMSNNYVFAGFDNMQARKDMFEKWVLVNKDNSNAIYLDGRLRMEYMEVFCVLNTQENIERYRKHLFADSDVEDDLCTAKQTSHAAAMIASRMVASFTNFLTNIKTSSSKRSVPFFWSYFIPLDIVDYSPSEE